MSICILGAGSVGGTLGRRWARAGHTVVFGVRDPAADKVRSLLDAAGEHASAAGVEEAAGRGEVIVLAVPWGAVETVLEEAGGKNGRNLSGKVLLDATNPLTAHLELALGFDASAGETVAALAHGARVVKIFNTVGANVMADPVFGDAAAQLFYCGDDTDAKAVAHRLAAELGFDPRDAGGLAQARLLEPLALLWIRLAVGGWGREISWHMLRR